MGASISNRIFSKNEFSSPDENPNLIYIILINKRKKVIRVINFHLDKSCEIQKIFHIFPNSHAHIKINKLLENNIDVYEDDILISQIHSVHSFNKGCKIEII